MSRAREIADLGSPAASGLSNRNLIINGSCAIAQRGTSSTTSGKSTVDRFGCGYSQGSITQSQQSLSSSDAPYAEGLRKSFRATVSTASSNAGAYLQLEQPIEAQNIAQSGWEYTNSNSSLTFSFWAKSSLAGTYYIQFRTIDGTSYYYNKSFTLAASTWKKITCTVAGNSNLTINNDNGEGFRVLVVPDYGTTYTGDSEAVTDAWYTRTQTDGYFPNFAQDWQNTNGATFEITGVQLEVGDGPATPFEHEDFGTTLEKCRRYCYVAPQHLGYTVGTPYATVAPSATIQFSPIMRASPAVTGTFTPQSGNAGTFAVASINYSYVHVYNSASNWSASQGVLVTDFKADAEL